MRAALTALLIVAAVPAQAAPCGVADAIPARGADAPDGTHFVRTIAALDDGAREAAFERELEAGNMPSFLRRTIAVALDPRVIVCVLPDYLAIGSDRDSLLVPLRLPTALRVAAKFGFVLPTARMVDAIYAQAAVHLPPRPLPAGDAMRSTAYYQQHNAIVTAQRDAVGAEPGVLIAGHKKDLVWTSLLARMRERVAIYGWHRAVASPIQPLSTVHGARYADYSHGVRLVGATIYVDGQPKSIFAALADPLLARILGEAPLPGAAALVRELAQ